MDEARLRTLVETGRSLVAERDLERLLDQIVEAAREVTGARYAALGVLDESREALGRFHAAGVGEDVYARIGELPQGRGILGVLVKDPRPLRLADLSEHPDSFGFPPGHPEMTSFLGVPILVRGEPWGNLYVTEKAAGEFDAEDEEAAVVLSDWAAIAVENARLFHGLEARGDELEKALRRAEAMNELAREVAGELEIERVLALVAERAKTLVPARAAVVLLREAGELVVVAESGTPDRGAVGARLPIEGTDAGRALRGTEPERSNGAVPSPLEALFDASAALMAPLRFRGRPVGLLLLLNPTGEHVGFSAEDGDLLFSFAVSAAAAVVTAQNVNARELRRSVESAEEERRRWARELHDQTLQDFGALRFLLAAPGRRGGEILQQAVDAALTEIDRGIESLQTLIADLRPAALDQLGLGPALLGLADRTRRISGIEVQLEVDIPGPRPDEEGRLPAELEEAAYRLIQEALTNAVKHSGARTAWVRVRARDEEVEVSVRDDGRGFEPAAVERGFGLVGMRERAALVGGEVRVSSTPGACTAVPATDPVARWRGDDARRLPVSGPPPAGRLELLSLPSASRRRTLRVALRRGAA